MNEDITITTTPEHVSYSTVDATEFIGKTVSLPYSRDSVWQTWRGENVRIRHLKDTHLANIIKWIGFHPEWYEQGLLTVMKKEADIRKLKFDFLEKAFLPYLHEDKWHLTISSKIHSPHPDEVVGR